MGTDEKLPFNKADITGAILHGSFLLCQFFLNCSLHIGVLVHTLPCQDALGGVTEQPVGIRSIPPPWWSQGLNSGCQFWWQEPLPTEPA